nr:hypothetical protein [Kibdelosporangium sp. MJ126-NF4]
MQRADRHAQTRRDLTDGQTIDVSGITHAPHCRRYSSGATASGPGTGTGLISNAL